MLDLLGRRRRCRTQASASTSSMRSTRQDAAAPRCSASSAGRRLHRQARRRRRGRAAGQSRSRHAAFRGVPGRGLALPRVASRSCKQKRRSGERAARRGLPRSRRRDQSCRSSATASRTRRRRSTTSDLSRRAAARCARLKAAGFMLVVVTNQPDVGKGMQRREVVDAMHAPASAAALPVDDISMCTHRAGRSCDCRKPKPGMLLAAARELGIDLAAASWSATAGATLKLAEPLVAGRSSSTLTIRPRRRRPTRYWVAAEAADVVRQ